MQWVWAAEDVFCRKSPAAGPARGLQDAAEQAEAAGPRCFLSDEMVSLVCLSMVLVFGVPCASLVLSQALQQPCCGPLH